jgi:curved DNA-binding protein CbpA
LQNYYQILEITTSANINEVRRAFRNLAKRYHPDVNSDATAQIKFQQINEAYQVLQDEEKRRLYDLRLQIGFPAQTIYYRPGNVRYRAKGDKYAHYKSKGQADDSYSKLEEYFDIGLFVVVFLLGCYGFLYGIYRLWVKPVEQIQPFPGIIMGIVFIISVLFFWISKRKRRKS